MILINIILVICNNIIIIINIYMIIKSLWLVLCNKNSIMYIWYVIKKYCMELFILSKKYLDFIL